MPQVLAGDVVAGGSYASPRQRLHEVTTRPLEYRASLLVDAASGLGFRVSDERHHAALRSEACDDVYVVRENGELLHVHMTAGRRFAHRGSHDLGISARDEPLSQPRVPRDVHV